MRTWKNRPAALGYSAHRWSVNCFGRMLAAVEIVLTELPLFQIADHRRPMSSDVVEFRGARGFDLYEVACLSPRPRDLRLRQGDVMITRRDSALLADCAWE